MIQSYHTLILHKNVRKTHLPAKVPTNFFLFSFFLLVFTCVRKAAAYYKITYRWLNL